MSDYRRYFVPGGTYFFTVVTYRRARLFDSPDARRLLSTVMRRARSRQPLTVLALVLLPNHLHCLWTLPDGDADYSGRWKWIKAEFTRQWLLRGGAERDVPASQVRERRRGVWQRRFWEHTIRDEDHLERHADYIHYNPVRHGLAHRPRDWPWSTFHRWVRSGHYSADWGRREPNNLLSTVAGE